MSQKSNRPQHDRSKRIKDSENNTIIQLIEREDGVVSNTSLIYLKFFGLHSFPTTDARTNETETFL